ncbi:uncharacterized protein LOC117229431 isoform X1 [Megalopta genalis]|uniref:uncharacterized protein LOC117229431 isoform X1 n=1 Tax=Megalopta genalis TaxID=115081 RepID=UPI001443454A|nr:uncharacterized protein LOC117221914 [Megalopta genalis]XP_033329123.1 uncharacterized protein LOC117221914 [Megalopta genalis]XP_033329124.1 uncharacterized protein LOC117221914 [Megalopta genalis]
MTEGATNKWSIEEREKMLSTGTLDQKKDAFKDDEELMKGTSEFVKGVIETASTEASKRKLYSEGSGVHEGSGLKGTDGIAGWNHRARGFCNRILNALCPCLNSNELFAWTSYRHRFTRP